MLLKILVVVVLFIIAVSCIGSNDDSLIFSNEDILTFVELNRNDKAIDMSAEIYLKKEREKKCPELKQIELIKKQRDRQAIKSKSIETQNAVIKCMQLI